MANTTLRAYVDDLNRLIEQEAFEEVIGHCRHILQHFPKNVDTYKVLGRALLERGRHDEAREVFARVLGALPDDFTAHLGMSIAYESSNLDAAIWHMARALEQEPHNATLHDEMRRLVALRDESAPEHLHMTRGALARLYLRSHLYDQAVAELQSALREAPSRFELSVLLARTYMDMGHEVEAGEIALGVLDKAPDCIEANRILGRLWLAHGRPSDAQPFIARLERLDPYAAWETVQPDNAPVPANAFQLPRMVWDARTAAAMATDVPEWVSSVGEVFETPEMFSPSSVPFASGAPGTVDPTGTFTVPVGTNPFAGFTGKTGLTGRLKPPEVPAPEANPDEPDWFRDVLSVSGGASVEETTPVAEESLTPGLAAPNWLDELVEGEAEAPVETAAGFDPMAWLQTGPLDAAAVAEEPQFAEPEFEGTGFDSGPDPMAWLQTGPLETPAVDMLPETPLAGPDPMAWLETGPLDTGALDESALEEESAPAADPMAWLQTGPLSVPAEPPSPTPADIADSLRFMEDAAEAPTSEPESAAVSVADAFDWQASMEPATQAADVVDEEEGDWLLGEIPGDVPSFDVVQPVADDTMLDVDWLLGGSAATNDTASLAASPAADTSDWLAGTPSLGDAESWFAETEMPSASAPLAADDDGWPVTDDFSSALAAELGMETLPDIDLSGLGEPEPGAKSQASVETFDPDAAPDWLASLPDATPSPAQTAPESAAETTFGWLSGGELDFGVAFPAESQPKPAEAAPSGLTAFSDEDALALDWIGGEDLPAPAGGASMPPVEPPSVEPTFAPMSQEPEPDPMAWLSQFSAGVPDAPEAAAITPPAEDMFSLAALGIEPLEAPPHETTLGSTLETPADAYLEAEQRAAVGMTSDDLLNWLQGDSEVPAQTAPPANLDWMQSAQPASAGEDWLSTLGTAPQPPMEAASVEPLKGEPETLFAQESVLEDEWLAGFETPAVMPEPGIAPAFDVAAVAPLDSSYIFGTSQELPGASAVEPLAEPQIPVLESRVDITPPAELTIEPPAEPESEEKLPLYKRKVTNSLPRNPTLQLSTGWADDVPTTPAPSPADTPAWMLEGDAFGAPAPATSTPQDISTEEGLFSGEAGEYFSDLLRETAERASNPRLSTGTGALESSDQPEWLSLMNDAPTASAQPAEPELSFGDTPDWLKAMSPQAETPAPPRVPIESLDFSDLAGPTFGETDTQATDEEEVEFKFDKTPAWKRRKKKP